jgi:hypothetical protein
MKEIAMTCINPLTRMDSNGRWRWYFADDFGNPIFASASVFPGRIDALRAFEVMLPLIRQKIN